MIASGFNESNTVLDPPKGMSADDCDSLSVYKGNLQSGLPVVISCWKVTAEELAEIDRTGRVWLMVLGETMPPCVLLGQSPFDPN